MDRGPSPPLTPLANQLARLDVAVRALERLTAEAGAEVSAADAEAMIALTVEPVTALARVAKGVSDG